MANEGFQTLGEVLGGGIDREGARLEGLLIGGKTAEALAKARIRRDEAEQRLKARQGFIDLGVDPTQAGGGATLARGGFGNAQQILEAIGAVQEQGTRAKIADPTQTPELGDINRQLFSLSNTPQSGVEAVGAGLFTDLLGPQAGSVQVAPTGAADIESTKQLGLLREAKRLHPEQFRNVTNIGLGVGEKPLGDQLVESAIEGGGVPEDIKFGGAAGIPGAIQSVANIGVEAANIIPFVDFDIPFEETERASNALRDIARRTELLLQDFVPGRPSNLLMEKLGQFSTDPGDVLRGEQRAKLRLEQTRDFLSNGVEEMRSLANNQTMFTRLTKSQQGKIITQLPQAASLLKAYERILSKFDQGPEGTIQGADALEIGATMEVAGGKVTRTK